MCVRLENRGVGIHLSGEEIRHAEELLLRCEER